jgi:hypothetical protein
VFEERSRTETTLFVWGLKKPQDGVCQQPAGEVLTDSTGHVAE